jgi:hypothetical protein
MERELVKIASDNPAHPKGYYIQFKDKMKPGDVEYGAKKVEPVKVDPVKIEPIKPKKKRK